MEANSFDYLVTTYHIPDKLNNCTIKTIGDSCIIDVIWHRNPNKSQIAFKVRDIGRSAYTEHNLYTNVNLENKNSNFVWTRSISYMCSTDHCNSLIVLKHLLDSLTLNDHFYELEYLLKKEEPFNSNWCSFKKNTTSFECAILIPSKSCKGCSFHGMGFHNSIEICVNCLSYDINETFLSHEVDFNITDRTRVDNWILECQSNSCNTEDNGDLIRQKSESNFDFGKFLDANNKSITFASTNKILLLFIAFLCYQIVVTD